MQMISQESCDSQECLDLTSDDSILHDADYCQYVSSFLHLGHSDQCFTVPLSCRLCAIYT